jgi:membrane protein DedA with SNARE-associated domain
LNGLLSIFGPFVEYHPLLAVFMFLLLFGFVLPITEEIALALAGVFIRSWEVDFFMAWGVGAAALITADAIYFALARYFGPRLLRFKLVRKFVKPEKVLAGERYFMHRGPGIVFACRFVVGLRMSGILAAGILRMNARKFIMYDGLAILLVTPIWLGVGWALGAQFDRETGWISRTIAILTPIAVIVGAFLIYRSIRADRALSETEGD